MHNERGLARPLALLLAATVAPLTLAVILPAQAAVAAANSARFVYNLAPGANSKAITPVVGKPVMVMGVQTVLNFRGVGFVTLLHVKDSFLEWVGLESTAGAAIAQGFSGTPGVHIVYLDYSHQVDIRVADPNSFVVHNGSTGQRTGNVTLLW